MLSEFNGSSLALKTLNINFYRISVGSQRQRTNEFDRVEREWIVWAASLAKH